jgi:hypothetical protein
MLKMAYSGSVTINGLSDQDLVKILEVKIKYEKELYFNPQQLQPVQQQPPHGAAQIYNNAMFNWNNEKGLEAVHKIISILLKKEGQQEKAA